MYRINNSLQTDFIYHRRTDPIYRKGFSNEEVNIGALFLADGGFLLSHAIEEAERNLKILLDVSREFGLDINKEKRNILI